MSAVIDVLPVFVRWVTFAQFTLDAPLAAPDPAVSPMAATLAKVAPASRTLVITLGAILLPSHGVMYSPLMAFGETLTEQ
jgi:hypothetical protein